MKKQARIMWIEDDENWIAFNCDSLNIDKVYLDTYELAQAIKDGLSTERWTQSEIDIVNKKFFSGSERLPEVQAEKIRLTLNVANTCNMQCGYCYANGGHYHSQEQLMSTDVAKRAIDLFYDHFHEIGSIKFIGGEPLLNFDVIKFVCNYVAELYQKQIINSMPSFIIATNGTILNQEIIDYSNKYHWRVGLSFDGQDWLHDMVRTDRNGDGTSKLIKQNIKKWQEDTNGKCPSSINACYSRIHEKNGVSVAQAVMYMRDELGVEKINIVPVDASQHPEYQLKSPELFGEIGAELAALGESAYQRYAITKLKKLEKLLLAKYTMPKEICKAGITTFGISSRGVISPCHLLTDDNGFYMGSVFDETPFSSEDFIHIHEMLKSHDRYSNTSCSNCFANRICSGCLGGNLFRSGDPWTCDPEVCTIFKRAVINLIKRIAHNGENKK